ncbi:MAG: hypothetical protein QGI82_00725 [Candidatus Pacebacteria bacterium]|nr:hypothetical protein [Candidatus Paceibacterota bacterium]
MTIILYHILVCLIYWIILEPILYEKRPIDVIAGSDLGSTL